MSPRIDRCDSAAIAYAPQYERSSSSVFARSAAWRIAWLNATANSRSDAGLVPRKRIMRCRRSVLKKPSAPPKASPADVPKLGSAERRKSLNPSGSLTILLPRAPPTPGAESISSVYASCARMAFGWSRPTSCASASSLR